MTNPELLHEPRSRHALAAVLGLALTLPSFAATLPDGFVYVDEVIPSVRLEMRYASSRNFIGRPIDGYLAPRAILTRQAAQALHKVQEELRPLGLGLKIFDAYRPQRAVNHFIRWAEDAGDVRMKGEYYPAIDKRDLFKEGYIARRSGHS